MMTAPPPNLAPLLTGLRDIALKSGVFGPVRLEGPRLICEALRSAAPAEYRVDVEAGTAWVSLVTADRWLSESIETDLLHTGDKLDELIEEELAELDYTGPSPGFQHYRSDDKLFTFRSAVPLAPGVAERADAAAIGTAGKCLLAYEACFRNLGDMQAREDE